MKFKYPRYKDGGQQWICALLHIVYHHITKARRETIDNQKSE